MIPQEIFENLTAYTKELGTCLGFDTQITFQESSTPLQLERAHRVCANILVLLTLMSCEIEFGGGASPDRNKP